MSRASNGKAPPQHDVIVVGAGAAGVGIGVALAHAGIEDVLIVDRHDVGASFARWPREMRFITPSFPTNSIGMLDLNSVAIGTSPAYSLRVEHPTGREYAAYLQGVASHFELTVRSGIDVQSLDGEEGGFALSTGRGLLRAKNVVWAAGEFQYPHLAPFSGAKLCRHNAQIESWGELPGREAIVIGGYESGIDAAIHLARLGKRVMVLDRSPTPPWKSDDSDPSRSLSTYTIERLQEADVAPRVQLASGADVRDVRRSGRSYVVRCASGREFRTASPPILATGFRGSLSLVERHFESRPDGFPLLSDQDESTLQSGLFLTGPLVRHDEHVFCFIYKFRQRFAVVAKAIADRLGLPADGLETYRQWGMYLDDLSCCGEECVC
jgi:putative flavoprotein involved in K+ transport